MNSGALSTQVTSAIQNLSATPAMQPAEPAQEAEGNGTAEPAADNGPEAAPEATDEADEGPAEPEAPQNDTKRKAFIDLKKRERAIQLREAELKEKLSQIERYEQARQHAAEAPLEYLDESGLSFQQIAEHVQRRGDPTPEQVRDAEIDKLRRRLDEQEEYRRQTEQQAQTTRREAAAQQMLAEIHNVVDNSPDYELTKAFGAQQDVFEVIRLNYQQTGGEVMEYDEAAKKVESWLEQQIDKLTTTQKFKAKYGGAKTPSATEKRPTTLSNRDAGKVPPPPKAGPSTANSMLEDLIRKYNS